MSVGSVSEGSHDVQSVFGFVVDVVDVMFERHAAV